MQIDIKESQEYKEILKVFGEIPKRILYLRKGDIVGMEKYFENKVMELLKRNKEILFEEDIEKIKYKVKKLSNKEKEEICAYAALRTTFGKKLVNSKNINISLGLKPNSGAKKLLEYWFDREYLQEDIVKYDYLIECPACKQKNEISILYQFGDNYMAKKIIDCNKCGHVFRIEFNYYSSRQGKLINYLEGKDRKRTIYDCQCNKCLEGGKEFWSKIFDLRNNLEKVLFKLVEKEKKENQFSEKFLKNSCEIGQNYIDKDIEELLRFEPNREELEKYIRIKANLEDDEQYIRKILSKLKDRYILYPKYSEEDVLLYLNNYIREFDRVLDILETNIYKYINVGIDMEGIIIELKNQSMRIELEQIRTVFSIDRAYRYEINPYIYYLNRKKELESQKMYNVFNSPSEMSLFRRLRTEYKNCIIDINIGVRTLINDKALNELFSEWDESGDIKKEKAIKIFTWCIIDFLVCDEEGYIIKGIELQRGNHHNNKEQREKDKVKKYGFEKMGIPLEYEY